MPFNIPIVAQPSGAKSTVTVPDPAVTTATPPGTAQSVSQFGITWTFDRAYPVGQFVNGDWWVVGPVQVVSVSPAPSVAPADEVNDLVTSRYGANSFRNPDTDPLFNTLRNGSMVVMTYDKHVQGYDSRALNWQASSSITYPYQLAANRSLISSVSNTTSPVSGVDLPLCKQFGEVKDPRLMKTAAVLTCLSTAPPVNAFRPCYAGGVKTIYTTSQLRWDRLLSLPAPAGTPALSVYERFLERPWLDHGEGIWTMQQFCFPSDNQPKYAREDVRAVGGAGLLLNLNFTQDQKRKLLYGLIQRGIDTRGLIKLGSNFWEGGGLTSGRKWPTVFAGLILDDPAFFPDPATTMIHEDVQTYYGLGWAGQRALWKDVKVPFEERPPSQWTADDKHNDGYRRCCNAKAWPAQALACLLMKGKAAWNHNAYFEYVDDWMRKTDNFAAGRAAQGVARPAEEGKSHDVFVDNIWAAYRDSVPAQPDGTVNLKWNSGSNKPIPMQWVANPRPA